MRILYDRFMRDVRSKLGSGPAFTFRGKEYKYFYAVYGNGYENERVIEIPIAWKFVKDNWDKNILEVGNVLHHHFTDFPFNYDVVDKYEEFKGVINQDICNFNPEKKYDVILCISTLEHIGLDSGEEKSDIEPHKALRAINNMVSMLTKNGVIFVTIPMGYNKHLDQLLHSEQIKFTERYCMRKTSNYNTWEECNWNDIKDSKQGTPFRFTNGLLIGVIKNYEG